ncbi:hypothetical protein C8R44DRAFT_731124 [Mycena epipterygia]|nr:hypothetical protein C8R44DRAFT_731124 [Mycena epipterygia]
MGNACKPLLVFGWEQAGGMACQAIKMACKPKSRAWAGDPTQIHAPARHKPFRAGASHSAKPKMSLSFRRVLPMLRHLTKLCNGGKTSEGRLTSEVHLRSESQQFDNATRGLCINENSYRNAIACETEVKFERVADPIQTAAIVSRNVSPSGCQPNL